MSADSSCRTERRWRAQLDVTALYPGKFDPFHNGHLDIARRAVALYRRLVVAVYASPISSALFGAEERAELVRAGVGPLERVQVVTYHGLTVDAARAQGAQVIVRGLRNIADYEYERQVGMANRQMAPETEHCLMMTSAEYAFLSATILKEVAELQGDVAQWAPAPTVAALQARFAQNGCGSEEGRNPDVRTRMAHQG